jgi:hypothetical protein
MTEPFATANGDTARIAARAMRLLDKIVAEKPEKNEHDFSEAVRCLIALRDSLIAERRGADPPLPPDTHLRRLNGIIGAVVGGHFPIGALPWKSVEAARDGFRALIAEMALPGGEP